MNSYKAGLFAEFWARMYLRVRGYRILATRHTTGKFTGRAEIDIIAQRGDTIVFAEVKNRPDFITGANAVSNAQALRLRRAAETYLVQRRWTKDARFDLIIVCGLRVHHIKNAF